MTPIEQTYYLHIMNYIRPVYGVNDESSYSTAVENIYQTVADYEKCFEWCSKRKGQAKKSLLRMEHKSLVM